MSGGGSGGHVFPAIAIADAIKKEAPDTEFLFIGANGKIDPTVLDLDGLMPKDVWDASSGSAPSATPSNKDYWIVNVAGNHNLNGINSWVVGDRALYINNAWTKIPVAAINTYNALDQTNAGFQLDARQGKALKDLIDNLTSAIADNEAAIDGLETDLLAAEDEIATLTTDKQDKLTYLIGTINSDKYTHSSLIDLDINVPLVIVNGQILTTGMMTKLVGSDTIEFPAGLYDEDTQIKILSIPQ